MFFVDESATVDLDDFRRLGDDCPFIVVDDAHDRDDYDGILGELVECNQIDDYWIQAFLASLGRSDLQSAVRLLRSRVEHAESLEESENYRPVPFNWHDKWRLESRGARDRRRILEELRDWAAEDVPGNVSVSRSYAREHTSEWCGRIPMALKPPDYSRSPETEVIHATYRAHSGRDTA